MEYFHFQYLQFSCVFVILLELKLKLQMIHVLHDNAKQDNVNSQFFPSTPNEKRANDVNHVNDSASFVGIKLSEDEKLLILTSKFVFRHTFKFPVAGGSKFNEP